MFPKCSDSSCPVCYTPTNPAQLYSKETTMTNAPAPPAPKSIEYRMAAAKDELFAALGDAVDRLDDAVYDRQPDKVEAAIGEVYAIADIMSSMFSIIDTKKVRAAGVLTQTSLSKTLSMNVIEMGMFAGLSKILGGIPGKAPL